MKKKIFLFLILYLGHTSFLYCQEESTGKNNLKVSLISGLLNTKLQYERALTKGSSIGIIASYYYPTGFSGMKIEPVYRYYFKEDVQKGWYFEQKVCYGVFNTSMYYEENYFYSDSHTLFEVRFFSKKLSFSSLGVAMKAGNQNLFGKRNNIVFDLNFGLQYFPLNFKNGGINDRFYIDNQGNEILVQTNISSDWTYEVLWYVFGPGSIFQSNISLGYRF
jgi:hypothetical protein